MARRRSRRRSGSRKRRGRTRSATKRHTQHSRRTIVITETRGRGSKRTTAYEEVYEEEW